MSGRDTASLETGAGARAADSSVDDLSEVVRALDKKTHGDFSLRLLLAARSAEQLRQVTPAVHRLFVDARAQVMEETLGNLSAFYAMFPGNQKFNVFSLWLSEDHHARLMVSEADAPPVVRAGLLQSTLILLPAEEKVATVFGGDTVDWVFDGGHVASRFISVKPKVPNSTTDIHIVSDHGIDYTLELREVSSDTDDHFDSKVFLQPGDKSSKDKLAELPVFVPAADLEKEKEEVTKAKEEVVAAKAASAATIKVEDAKAEQYRSQYPGTLHFDYTWDRKKGTGLGLEQVWHDDKFTYLRGHFQETPALYEIKDGKGSLINFDFAGGLYTVPKELDNGYLAIGKRKVEFHRSGKGEYPYSASQSARLSTKATATFSPVDCTVRESYPPCFASRDLRSKCS